MTDYSKIPVFGKSKMVKESFINRHGEKIEMDVKVTETPRMAAMVKAGRKIIAKRGY